MDLFRKISDSLRVNQHLNAFCINDHFYTYHDLAVTIARIRNYIALNMPDTEKNIGLIANDDLETYAAIIALWFEGRSYVPVNQATPAERNNFILRESAIKTIIDSSGIFSIPGYTIIDSSKLPPVTIDADPKPSLDSELAYILFTSGTTGIPKGVAITRANLSAFVNAFGSLVDSINEKDRWLQMFDLTFDLSVMSYLIPLLNGACVYTIPPQKIKYSYIVKLMDEYRLTGALLVPSVIHYLRPFFPEIDAPDMKYCLFCGEALSLALTEEWTHCIPNATIMNLYGPTENTIFCNSYIFKKDSKAINKVYKDILSIGRSMKDTFAIIVDDNNNRVAQGEKGELCLGGSQLSPGYRNNEEKNNQLFFYTNYNGRTERFYKTGDICLEDEDGDIFFIGRTDTQVKIQGFRVELLEVEFYAKKFLGHINVFASTVKNIGGNNEIVLVIESEAFNSSDILGYLRTMLPVYMLPSRVAFQPVFPYTENGKIDRGLLKEFSKAK